MKSGGLNAQEIKELERLTPNQYTEVGRQLSEIKKVWWLLPDYVWFMGVIAGVISIF